MSEIHVLERGVHFSYSFDEMLKYHGTEYPGGVAHAFKVMERAFPLLSDKTPPERREISLVTAFGGPGGRDAFEMVTRCVTDGRLHVDKNLPEAADAIESPGGRYYFRFTYRGRSVEITIRPGHVRDKFIQLARKKDRTPEEETELAGMKREMADRLMASKAEDIYDAKVL